MPSNGGSAGAPGGSGSPTGRMPHERSRVPTQRSGVTAISVPSTAMRALPGAHLREPLGVQGDPRPGAHHVRLLLDDVEGALPGEVESDALGLLQHHAEAAQRLEHLEPVAPDVLLQALAVDGVGEVHGGLLVAAAHEDEGVLGAEVRVVAQTGDHEDLAAAVVGVEVAAVVEVAVRGAGPGHRQRHLVDRELVEPTDHQAPTSARSWSRSGLWWNRVSRSSGRSISPKWICRAPVRMKTMHHCTAW